MVLKLNDKNSKFIIERLQKLSWLFAQIFHFFKAVEINVSCGYHKVKVLISKEKVWLNSKLN